MTTPAAATASPGFENIIGGQGGDVFASAIASVARSSAAPTAAAAITPPATGSPTPATPSASRIFRSVQVNRRRGAFGSTSATTIQVRAFQRIFGGTAATASPATANNCWSAAAAPTLEGQAAHDLLVADTFVTYGNLSPGQTRPLDSSLKNVADNFSLQAVGAAEFGARGAWRWIWRPDPRKPEPHHRRRPDPQGRQRQRRDPGAPGGDIINIGGNGEGNDTILADPAGCRSTSLPQRPGRPPASATRAAATTPSILQRCSNLLIAGNGKETSIWRRFRQQPSRGASPDSGRCSIRPPKPR